VITAAGRSMRLSQSNSAAILPVLPLPALTRSGEKNDETGNSAGSSGNSASEAHSRRGAIISQVQKSLRKKGGRARLKPAPPILNPSP